MKEESVSGIITFKSNKDFEVISKSAAHYGCCAYLKLKKYSGGQTVIQYTFEGTPSNLEKLKKELGLIPSTQSDEEDSPSGTTGFQGWSITSPHDFLEELDE